ncbi:MAG: stimulus-sensing domain-containing protein [Spirochaetales bacterium]|nr:stimulus-sensing domain-containing protein [Spirochaetales bacterium]
MNRIALKILTFNLLLVFLPLGSFMFLDIYEQQLLRALENSLVQQGRLISAALSGTPDISAEAAISFIRRMDRQHTARYRILDKSGELLADSSILPDSDISRTASSAEPPEPTNPRDTRESFLYQVASTPVRMFRRFFLPPVPSEEAPIYPENLKEGPEVKAALEGKYGSFTRISSGGQISVTLYTALPVFNGNTVTGAAVVSQSTFRILRDLYEVRLRLFTIFLYSIAAAGLLTVISAITISYPLNKLREQALVSLSPASKNAIAYSYTKRSDEIGDLARSLSRLSEEVREHVHYIESFASDVSHEFKNPLASIRAAVDMIKIAKNDRDKDHFLSIITSETESLKSLLTGLRELSRLDMKDEQLPREELSVKETAQNVFRRLGCPQKLHILENQAQETRIAIEGILLEQVFANLLSNSADFSPPDSIIKLSIDYPEGRQKQLGITIEDSGPGFDPGSIEKAFDRFYSYRPQPPAVSASETILTGSHSGLGLAIVRSIVHYWQGSIQARNALNGNGDVTGAVISVTIPL